MPDAEKVDLFKLHKADYAAKKTPVIVDVATAQYLAISGIGKPGGGDFEQKVGALYGVAYTLKMTSKKAGRDYVVCKLEGVWSGAGGGPLDECPPEDWCWRLLIRTPDFIRGKQLAGAIETLRTKGKAEGVGDVSLEKLREGLCIQMLHVGPYDQEAATLKLMQKAAADQGLQFRGEHHEIYLSDPRRVDAAKLKTILRHPVA